MAPWQERLLVERDELAAKLAKLRVFLGDEENLKDMVSNDVALLIAQKFVMTNYLDILNTRIVCLKE